MGAVFAPILPGMTPCCVGPDCPRGGAEAEPPQPSCSCCCIPGRGPPAAIIPREAHKRTQTRDMVTKASGQSSDSTDDRIVQYEKSSEMF